MSNRTLDRSACADYILFHWVVLFGHMICLMPLAGCFSYPDQPSAPEVLDAVRQEIVNGTFGGAGLGVVGVSIILPDGGITMCSGSLITNQYALTTKECTSTTFPNAPAPPSVFRVVFANASGGAQSSPVVRLDWAPGILPANDLALLTLGTPISISGVSDSVSHRIAASVTKGTQLLCVGWGCTTEQCASETNATSLRTALLQVTAVSGMIEVGKNALGQHGTTGDFGSPCFPASDLSDTAPLVGAFIYDLAGTSFYSPPWTTKPFVDAIVMAPVDAVYSFVPPAPAPLPGVIQAVDATQSVTFPDSTIRTLAAFAPRGTRIKASVDGTASGYACPELSAVTPTSGSASLSGTCLSVAVIMAILM